MNRNTWIKFESSTSILSLALVLFICSCNNKKCTNSNFIFDKFAVDSKEYKTELAKQIENIGISNLTFSFEQYIKKEGNNYILINIDGKGLCAKGEMLVKEWGKLKGIRDASGVGYRGAEMKGLKIEIIHDLTRTEFVYKDVERIID